MKIPEKKQILYTIQLPKMDFPIMVYKDTSFPLISIHEERMKVKVTCTRGKGRLGLNLLAQANPHLSKASKKRQQFKKTAVAHFKISFIYP